MSAYRRVSLKNERDHRTYLVLRRFLTETNERPPTIDVDIDVDVSYDPESLTDSYFNRSS